MDRFRQDQFLNVLDRDEADRRFRAHLDLRPLPAETVPLDQAWGRVLASDLFSPIDVPGFDRSNVDGFAVSAADTFGATEEEPICLQLLSEAITPGFRSSQALAAKQALSIATGAMIPRGADSVVMVEHTDIEDQTLLIYRSLAPGGNVSFTGSDIGCGELILRAGERLTARETGVLAAVGVASVSVVRKPRVAILSTGNELAAPGEPLPLGWIYDSNQTVLANAVQECGGEPIRGGILPDDADVMRERLQRFLDCDMILLSGGTSKGIGDVSYRVVSELGQPGIIAHGVALKPGKPLCLAVLAETLGVKRARPLPIAVLPGFPTSAIFTFHEFLAPILRLWGGRGEKPIETQTGRLPMRINSEPGRTEFVLVSLVEQPESPVPIAYPLGKGSGSVTAFARADGFVVIPKETEYLEAGSAVQVIPIGTDRELAELVVIGSHCLGLDFLLAELRKQSIVSKSLAVGSSGGVEAIRRGECDLAGIHLLDADTGEYNRRFVPPQATLISGYGRSQGILFRPDDARFGNRSLEAILEQIQSDVSLWMVNRNRGSGTRILIDRFLGSSRPAGYHSESRSHQAVAAAVAQSRADWGIAIEPAAQSYGLGFLPLQAECYDFLVPKQRLSKPAVQGFLKLLQTPAIRAQLQSMGFTLEERM